MYIILFSTATRAATAIYGDTVAVSMAAAATTTEPTIVPTTAHIEEPFAVVAQGRAPIIGDMGARPIIGIFGNWCIICTKP